VFSALYLVRRIKKNWKRISNLSAAQQAEITQFDAGLANQATLIAQLTLMVQQNASVLANLNSQLAQAQGSDSAFISQIQSHIDKLNANNAQSSTIRSSASASTTPPTGADPATPATPSTGTAPSEPASGSETPACS
jgi:hypothetical protein